LNVRPGMLGKGNYRAEEKKITVERKRRIMEYFVIGRFLIASSGIAPSGCTLKLTKGHPHGGAVPLRPRARRGRPRGLKGAICQNSGWLQNTVNFPEKGTGEKSAGSISFRNASKSAGRVGCPSRWRRSD
jgi:hypothetical protein